MKNYALLFLVLLFTVAGCKKDDPVVVPDYTGIFVGTWRATTFTYDGQKIDLVGNTSQAIYLKVTKSDVNRISCILSTVNNAVVTDDKISDMTITKTGDNYTLNDVVTNPNEQAGINFYTSSTGEFKLIGIENGKTFEIIFKK